MSDINISIMDAAERRMRTGGYNGFSFRDIAAEIGIKSSSVHYHFRTKEVLAAMVIRRYTDRTIHRFELEIESGTDPVNFWVQAFRRALNTEEHMCLCVSLSVDAQNLPSEVALEVQRFYKMCLKALEKAGVTSDKAVNLFSLLTGAMAIVNALNDKSIYDQAVSDIMGNTESYFV